MKITKEGAVISFHLDSDPRPATFNLATKEIHSPAGNKVKSMATWFVHTDCRDFIANCEDIKIQKLLQFYYNSFVENNKTLTNVSTLLFKIQEVYSKYPEDFQTVEKYIGFILELYPEDCWKEFDSNAQMRCIRSIRKMFDYLSNDNIRLVFSYLRDLVDAKGYKNYSKYRKHLFLNEINMNSLWSQISNCDRSLYDEFMDKLKEKPLFKYINEIICHYIDKGEEDMLHFFMTRCFEYTEMILFLAGNNSPIGMIQRIYTYWLDEKINVKNVLLNLYDYQKMMRQMGRTTFTKYPVNLLTIHNIVAYNHSIYTYKFSDTEKAQYKENIRDVWFIDKDLMVHPFKDIDEVHYEGVALSHCVYSYVENCIATPDHQLLALRDTLNPTEPLVTIHMFKNKVVHARGVMNRKCTDREIEVIQKFCAKYKFIYADN